MTALLLDTHVLIWLLADLEISEAAHDAVQDVGNDLYLSIASPWEIAVKQSTGKLAGLAQDYLDLLVDQGIKILGIAPDHVRAVRDLPLHHRDPFDRMLVAQAQVEQLTLVTRDAHLGQYDVRVLSA